MPIRTLLCAICMMALCPLGAQVSWEVFNTSNSGLGYDWVNDIVVEDDGRVWFGTEFGLFSWDGSSWTDYPSGPAGPPDEVIRSLYLDAAGNLWIGTFMGGLCRYDGSSWTVWDTGNSPIPDNFVRDIEEDQDGKIWIGTTAGLAYLDGSSWMIFNTSSSTIPGNNIPTVFVDRDNVFWCGTINAGLCMFDGKGFVNWTLANSELTDNTVLDIAQDTAGNLWLATPAGGLNIFTPDGSFLDFNVVNSSIPNNEIFRLEIDPLNRGVLGFASAGVARFDGTNWELLDSAAADLPDNTVRAITIAPDSTVWAGTEEGAARLSDSSPPPPPMGLSDALEASLSVYPNPAADNFTVVVPPEVDMQRTGSVSPVLDWYAPGGQHLARSRLIPVRGAQTVSIPEGLAPGQYILVLRSVSRTIVFPGMQLR